MGWGQLFRQETHQGRSGIWRPATPMVSPQESTAVVPMLLPRLVSTLTVSAVVWKPGVLRAGYASVRDQSMAEERLRLSSRTHRDWDVPSFSRTGVQSWSRLEG